MTFYWRRINVIDKNLIKNFTFVLSGRLNIEEIHSVRYNNFYSAKQSPLISIHLSQNNNFTLLKNDTKFYHKNILLQLLATHCIR